MIQRFFIALVLAFLAAPPAVAGTAGPTLVFDPSSGEVISYERAGEPWYPASLTKLLTAYLVFEELRSGRLRLDQAIPVSTFANAELPSKIGVGAGRTVTVDFALQALLVYSANDMAVVLAEAVAGNVHRFARLMNEAARRLGMTGSHFVNPNGLFDPRQVTTAKDLAVLAAAIVREHSQHWHYFSQPFLKIGKRKLLNRNALIRQMPDSDGMKTGFVCNSGFNLVGSASRNGRKLLAIILGAPSPAARADLAQMLLTDAFTRPNAAARTRLDDLKDDTLGTLVPADLTAAVCRKKPVVELTPAQALSGWGISFGVFASAQKADMALRGRLLSPAGLGFTGKAGVVRMPGKNRFSAVVWGLEPAMGETMCAQYSRDKVPCEPMTPENFSAIAAATPPDTSRMQKAAVQGAEGAPRMTTIKKK